MANREFLVTNPSHVRLWVILAGVANITDFRCLAICSLAGIYRYFGGTWYLHLPGIKWKQISTKLHTVKSRNTVTLQSHRRN
jgi:hypothetical protein